MAILYPLLLGLLGCCLALATTIQIGNPYVRPPIFDRWSLRIEGGHRALARLTTARRNVGALHIDSAVMARLATPWAKHRLQVLSNRCTELTWTFKASIFESQAWLLQRAHTFEGVIIREIIRTRGVVLIRMPKTAGTSIVRTLENRPGGLDVAYVGGPLSLDNVNASSLVSHQVLVSLCGLPR
jgi:hypothetical protein